MQVFETVDLGRMSYGEALTEQERRHAAVLAAREGGGALAGTILTVEHDPPVITMTRRAREGGTLLATAQMLARAGVTVAETDRGGDITYHGPGQLVVYPIVDLNALKLGLHEYIRALEGAVVDALAEFGVEGRRDPPPASATGVWVGSEGAGGAKIAAMGVRVRRWVTLHGLALNVTTDLSHFGLIVPCGLAGRPVTSLARVLAPAAAPAMAEVRRVLLETLTAALTRRCSGSGTLSHERCGDAGGGFG